MLHSDKVAFTIFCHVDMALVFVFGISFLFMHFYFSSSFFVLFFERTEKQIQKTDVLALWALGKKFCSYSYRFFGLLVLKNSE